MNIAIIPARGGSKRIPRKNIRPFLGKPIIAYSIEAAIKSGCFDRIIVSTDDAEIAQVAEECGAEIPFVRSANLADHYTGTNAVVADAIQRLSEEIEVEYACCIYATAPFISPDSISSGLTLLKESSENDYSVTVTTFPFPVQRACYIDNDKTLNLSQPDHRITRSQDLPEMYHDAGQVYWGKAESFLKDKPLFSGNTSPNILPRYMVQDIDTQEDWVRAECMYQVLKVQGLI